MTVNPGSPDFDREDRVRALAYRLWEEEGQPEGMAEEHWRRAAAILDAEETESEAPAEREDPPGSTSGGPSTSNTDAADRRSNEGLAKPSQRRVLPS
jgi:hypothetical protein